MQEFAQSLTLLGIPLLILIPFIVEGMKSGLGMPARFGVWASLAWAIVLLGLAQALKEWPELTPFATIIVGTLVIGLGGSGLFDFAKAAAGAITTRSNRTIF